MFSHPNSDVGNKRQKPKIMKIMTKIKITLLVLRLDTIIRRYCGNSKIMILITAGSLSAIIIIKSVHIQYISTQNFANISNCMLKYTHKLAVMMHGLYKVHDYHKNVQKDHKT